MEQASLVDAADLPLVRRCKKGEAQAFNDLVLKYKDRIYTTIYRMVGDPSLSDDLCQDTFVKAYGALGAFKEQSAFFTWLYRIAVNLCLSHRRSRRRSHEVLVAVSSGRSDDEPLGFDPPDPAPGPTTSAESADTVEKVHAAIQSLPEEFRVVLIARDIDGLAYEQIADVLDLPVGTVRSRIHRGREELKEKLRALVEE